MLDTRQRMDARFEALLVRADIEDFNNAYCAALDAQQLEEWTGFFTEDAFYSVISRENAEAGYPVGLIHCEGRGMIRDRAFALLKTAMFGPRYLRHMVSNLAVDAPDASGAIRARANYIVFEVLTDRPDARILQVGQFRDVFRHVDGALKLAERRCVYDNLLVPTALCIPV